MRPNRPPLAHLRDRVIAGMMSLAIVVAPLLALVISVEVALAVAICALLTVALVVRRAAATLDGGPRRRLLALALLNGALALLCLVVLAGRVVDFWG